MIYWIVRRNVRGAVVLGLAVVSHRFLDLIVHRPDLPIFPGASPHVGIGFWHSLPATLLIEGAALAGGTLLYVRVTRPKNRTGTVTLWGLIGLPILIYAANVFGPRPASVEAIAWAGHLQWVLIELAYWVDRNRVYRDAGM